ncbi:MAG: carbohydrate kinase family protein [Candidatus Aenigmarchaeota archaeon]
MVKLDLVAFGHLGMDVLRFGEREVRRPGGSAPNTASFIQGLGMKAGIIGRTGLDEEGKRILSELEARGVDTSRVRKEGKMPTCHIEVTPEDRKVTLLENIRPFITLTEEDREYLKSSRAVLVGTRLNIFREVAEFCSANGIALYVTLHVVSGQRDENVEGLKDLSIRAILSNEEEAERFKPILKEMAKKGTQVVITKGREGCKTLDGKAYPGFRTDVQDPTGAGDAFAAGFIYGDLNGWETERKCTFANAMGALASSEAGARGKARSLGEAESFMEGKA